MKRLLLVVASAFILSGCLKDPESVQTVGNGEFQLAKLFEKDGCTMYRFMDGGHAIYWSNCAGRTQYQYQSGKTTHREQETTSE